MIFLFLIFMDRFPNFMILKKTVISKTAKIVQPYPHVTTKARKTYLLGKQTVPTLQYVNEVDLSDFIARTHSTELQKHLWSCLQYT